MTAADPNVTFAPWRPPSDADTDEMARRLSAAWRPAFNGTEGSNVAFGFTAHRLADLSWNYGSTVTMFRNEPCKRWEAWLYCPCADEVRIQLTDEQVRRGWWEPLIGEVGAATGHVRDHAETCPRATRRPGRPHVDPPPLLSARNAVLVGMAGVCGADMGCTNCQLPAGHIPSKHNGSPEPLTRPDNPRWAIQTPTRKDTPDG